jgi:5-methyltetrahydrofolate--homocysteine methyltransferase
MHELVEAMANMKEKDALRIVDEMLEKGEDPNYILDLSSEAMAVVGERYQEGTYFLPELIMSGEMLKKIGEVLKPRLAASTDQAKKLGVVVLGTVRGDIHDIGKSILVTLLRSYGLVVHDLGVDVPPAEVARQVVELAPDVVGLSGLLTAAHASMRETVAELRRIAPRLDRAPTIIIGGGAVDEQVREWSGADLWAADAVRGVELIRRHAGGQARQSPAAQ